jgi:hypothetical protein
MPLISAGCRGMRCQFVVAVPVSEATPPARFDSTNLHYDHSIQLPLRPALWDTFEIPVSRRLTVSD